MRNTYLIVIIGAVLYFFLPKNTATSSNQDGRGSPKANDDKIIRINSQKL